MKMPEIVKRTRDYIIVKIYLPNEGAAQTPLAKKKGKTKGIKRGLRSHNNRRKT